MAPPAPVVQASPSSVAVGENLRVSCSVVGEQDVVVEFAWEYPGQQVRHSQLIIAFCFNNLQYGILAIQYITGSL